MAEELTGLERAMIQMILTDRWNPSRLNRKIANHFELTIDEVCCIRQRPAFMAGLERQRQISEQDFVPLADRLERVVALQQLFERVPDARVALRMKILREIRTLVLDLSWVYDRFLQTKQVTPMGGLILFGYNFDLINSLTEIADFTRFLKDKYALNLSFRNRRIGTSP